MNTHSEYTQDQILESIEAFIAYSDDAAILKNAAISYAIIEAIKSGDLMALQSYKNNDSFSNISHYEVGSSLRKSKNLSLTSNTLACHAAEAGGAPVVYVRTVCADFAQQIEACTNHESIIHIRSYLLDFYCQTVRDTNLKDCSPIAKTCYSYLYAHLSEEISMKDTAVYCHVSYEYLSRTIKQNFHCNFSALLHSLRINRACIYLHTTKSISDIAERVGYKNASQFCHAFSKIKGTTPKKWRNQNVITS